jgi:5-carboxyvanillate decarboxylase
VTLPTFPPTSTPAPQTGGSQGYLRIATEEAFATPEIVKEWLALLDDPEFDDPGFRSLWSFYGTATAERPRFILEHLQDLDDKRIKAMDDAGLDGAIWGFAVETGTHLLRLITKGVFDRFPNLKFVVGHLGEALPFWLYRLDYMHAATVRSKRYESTQPIELKVSEYMRRNVWITTSGMSWAPAIMFCREVLGADRVMYAMDYPYEYQVDEVRWQDDLPLTVAEKKRFFQTNAETVFHLNRA